jgi:hypothetical protein
MFDHNAPPAAAVDADAALHVAAVKGLMRRPLTL